MAENKALVCERCGATSVGGIGSGFTTAAGAIWSRAVCRGGHVPVEYVPKEKSDGEGAI